MCVCDSLYFNHLYTHSYVQCAPSLRCLPLSSINCLSLCCIRSGVIPLPVLIFYFFLFTFLWPFPCLSFLHMQHHVCTVCERSFQGHPFFERGGRAYCERHFDMVSRFRIGLTLMAAPCLPSPCLARLTQPPYKGYTNSSSTIVCLSNTLVLEHDLQSDDIQCSVRCFYTRHKYNSGEICYSF